MMRERLAELRAGLDALRAARSRADRAADRADRGRTATCSAHQLARIEAALERLDMGSYGYCSGCGSRLPLSRLDADPSTSHCGACED